jgi:hypothetical protein
MTLDEARENIGRGAIYQPYEGAPVEAGDITSVNERFVFVHYAGDRQSKATRAEDLRWETP